MKKQHFTVFSIICLLNLLSPRLHAQDGSAKAAEEEKEARKTVHFNGLGRTYLGQTAIDGNILESDSATVRNLTDGEFLLDLILNATPNDKTEVQAILRLRNEFGGFFGAGQTIEVRELWARGVIANALKYRVGDMDLVMSPYTLYNPLEEGVVNEAAVFAPQREVIYYEQFYTDANTRRLQGAKLDFGLDFTEGLKDAEFSAFLTRIRGTDFFTIPSRFVAGGSAMFNSVNFNDSLGMKASVGVNYVNTFDDLQSGEATTGIRNSVFSVSYNLTAFENKKLALRLVGESGKSSLENRNDSVSFFKETDTFLDVGVRAEFKPQKVAVTAAFVDVGPDFFSIGAQSKRVNFDADKSYYDRIGVDDEKRDPALFDLTRDRALYTFQLSDRLMPYDARYSNTLPYGTATPNRRGLRLDAIYGSDADRIEARIDAALMSEIRGQGTNELKNFSLLRAAANVNIHHYLSWEKNLRFTFGYQYENVDRGGVEIEQVDLQSNLIDLGLEAELFESFELLLGAKLFSANGREYPPRIDSFNDVIDFPTQLNADDSESLIGAGFKYEFKKGIYLTVQYQQFDSKRGVNNPLDYGLNQVFALFNMTF